MLNKFIVLALQDDESMDLEPSTIEDGLSSSQLPSDAISPKFRLTLGTVKEQLDKICFKKENCPPGLVGNSNNIEALIKAIVRFSQEVIGPICLGVVNRCCMITCILHFVFYVFPKVHPVYWKYLFEQQSMPGNALGDPDLLKFGPGKSAVEEITIKSVNWHRVLGLCKHEGYS